MGAVAVGAGLRDAACKRTVGTVGDPPTGFGSDPRLPVGARWPHRVDMDIHRPTPKTTARSFDRNVVRYALCTALAAVLFVGGALLTDSSSARPKAEMPSPRSQSPSVDRDEPRGDGPLSREAQSSAGSGDFCRGNDLDLRTAKADSSWIDVEVTQSDVDLRLSHPQGWTIDHIDLGMELGSPEGNLYLLVAADGQEEALSDSALASVLATGLPDFDIRGSERVEVAGVPACHMVGAVDGSEAQVEMWVTLSADDAMVVVTAKSRGEASSSEWAVARGIVATISVASLA